MAVWLFNSEYVLKEFDVAIEILVNFRRGKSRRNALE